MCGESTGQCCLPSPILFYLRGVAAVLVRGGLNHRPQSRPIIFAQGSEPEWLLTTGDGTQHFRRTKHRSRVSYKHHCHLTALTQRFGKGEQTARGRDDLQFAGDTPTVLESKDGGSDICELQAWWALSAVCWREERHG